MNRRGFQLTAALLVGVAVLDAVPVRALPNDEAERFSVVKEGYSWSFPRDHGSHEQYATEWWYVTGHLHGAGGRTFGFELVFFRIGIEPGRVSRSSWAATSLHLAHAAVTDDQNKRFYFIERRSRGSFDDAHAAAELLDLKNGPLSLRQNGDVIELHLESEESSTSSFMIDLQLRSRKPPILHGKNGFSRKGPKEGEASQYYSLTRMEGTGTVRVGTETVRVERASAWMDQEFTSSGLAHGTLGWDWFAIQLDDGRELMLYQLKDEQGAPNEFSSGTLVQTDGTAKQVARSDAVITPLRWWTSPRTGIRYPAMWRVVLEKEGIAVDVVPTVADQELQTQGTTGVTYWEGRCQVTRVGDESAVIGESYVELVGWDRRASSNPAKESR